MEVSGQPRGTTGVSPKKESPVLIIYRLFGPQTWSAGFVFYLSYIHVIRTSCNAGISPYILPHKPVTAKKH